MKFLYALGSPQTFYQKSGAWADVLAILAVLSLSLGWGFGLFWAPADYQQGEMVRLIYIHVPAAFLSMSIYFVMSISALGLWVWRIKIAGIMMHACARLGLLMTFLALVTGAIWGQPTWGTWWVWDARLSSEFVLFLIYASLLAIFQSLGLREATYRIVAIITWVGLIDLPIIHYSVQWWNTLHQGTTLLAFAKPKIHVSMLYPLLCSIFGMACFCFWAILSLTRLGILRKDHQQKWVRSLING